MHVLHYQMRPVGRLTQRAQRAITVKPGDTVEWQNPNTGLRFPDLLVQGVNKTTGSLLVKGFRGRAGRSGAEHAETFNVRAEHCTVTKKAGE